jgi:hypothetical protein
METGCFTQSILNRRFLFIAAWLAFCAAGLTGYFAGDNAAAGPIPLAQPGLGSAIRLGIQAVVIAALLTLPGLALLRWLGRGILPTWSGTLLIGVSTLLSCGIVTSVVILTTRLANPSLASQLFILVTFAAAIASLPALFELAPRLQTRLRPVNVIAWAILAATYLLFAAGMSATPYPAVVQELLDAPNFCRIAANLAERGSLSEDYFIYLLKDGAIGYPTSLAIVPVSLTAASYWLFGLNAHSFFVVHLFIGFTALYVAAGITAHAARHRWISAGAVGALLMLIPAVIRPIGWGSIGAPIALALLVIWHLEIQAAGSRGIRRLCQILILATLPITRPEGAFIAAAIVATFMAIALAKRMRESLRPLAPALVVTAGFVALALMVNRSETIARNPSAVYVHYDDATGTFEKTRGSYDYYRSQLNGLLANQPAVDLANHNLGSQMLEHPLAYAAFALQRLGPNLAAIGRDLAGDGVIGVALVLLLLVIAGLRREHWPVLFAAFCYLTILGVFNDLAGPRHRDAILILLVVMVARYVVGIFPATDFSRRSAGILTTAAVVACAPLAFHAARSVYWMRHSRENQYYSQVAANLPHEKSPNASIMSNYPTMMGCLTGARSVGGCWLVQHLRETADRFKPDTILIDNGPIERSYEVFERWPTIPTGYRVAVHDPKNQFILLTRSREAVAMDLEAE